MELDLKNIQGNILPGFNKDHQAFVFVRFGKATNGLKWLAAIQPEVASGEEVQGFKRVYKSVQERRTQSANVDDGSVSPITATWINLAISFAGLRLLGQASDIARFPLSFRANRVPGADPAAMPIDVDAVLIVAADRTLDLDDELVRQRTRMALCGVDEATVLRGDTLPGELRGHEHFGFKDGISQPQVAGTTSGLGPVVAAGEFILGLTDQTGQASGSGLPGWTRNGSFLAFLQLQQHVAIFWNTMHQQSKQLGVKPDEIAARIVGRASDGTPVDKDPSRLSHIGRAYSRWLGPTESSRHRIIRRGIPYGAPWQQGTPDADQRGLLFVAYQADIKRQFEHVLRLWLNGPDFPMPGAGRDALTGQVSEPGGADPLGAQGSHPRWSAGARRPALIPRRSQMGGPSGVRLPGFVTPHYGGYFLAPSISALAFLAIQPQGDTPHTTWSR